MQYQDDATTSEWMHIDRDNKEKVIEILFTQLGTDIMYDWVANKYILSTKFYNYAFADTLREKGLIHD